MNDTTYPRLRRFKIDGIPHATLETGDGESRLMNDEGIRRRAEVTP